MSTRTERRKVINRKDLDYDCPVDKEVVKLLHEYAIEYGAILDDDSGRVATGSQLNIETLKQIRKDVFKSIPGILEGDMTIVSTPGASNEGLQAN